MNHAAERQSDFTVWSLPERHNTFLPAARFCMSGAYLNATACTSWVVALGFTAATQKIIVIQNVICR